MYANAMCVLVLIVLANTIIVRDLDYIDWKILAYICSRFDQQYPTSDEI